MIFRLCTAAFPFTDIDLTVDDTLGTDNVFILRKKLKKLIIIFLISLTT